MTTPDTTPSSDAREPFAGKNPSSDYGVRGSLIPETQTPDSQTTDESTIKPTGPEQLDIFDVSETVTPVNLTTVTPVEVSPPTQEYLDARARLAESNKGRDRRVSSQVAGRLAASRFLDDKLGK